MTANILNEQAQAVVNQYNEMVRKSRHSKSERTRDWAITQMDKLMRQIAAMGRQIQDANPVTGEIKLVPTAEEQAELDRFQAAAFEQSRKFLIKRQEEEQARRVELYQHRLQEMIRDCQRELDRVIAGDFTQLHTSMWSSTAALDLPRLQAAIMAVEELKRAEHGQY